MFIQRKIAADILAQQKFFPVTTLTGPRQSGKTTLCRHLFPQYHYVNLENLAVRDEIGFAPKDFLEKHGSRGLIIDEAQRMPELFSYAQTAVDEDRSRRYVLTGSCNFALMQSVTQSLAGRTSVFKLPPLTLEELGHERCAETETNALIIRGGYPAVWAEGADAQSLYAAYYETYVERDLRLLQNVRNLSDYRRFAQLCAGAVGTELNVSRFADDLGISRDTVQAWLSTLEAAYIVFRLPPFFRNIRKRITKSPKLYFCDTGLACWMLGISTPDQLAAHPLRGALFENLVVAEIYKRLLNSRRAQALYFYRDSQQKEVDLVEDRAGTLCASEIKAARSFHKDFFRNLDYFRKVFGNAVAETRVIYDGDFELSSERNGVVNFRNL